MFYSLITLLGKIGNSLAAPFSLLILQWTGYQSGAAVQTERALLGIRLVIGPVPAILLIGGIVFAIFYPLSREQHHEIVEELHKRREARKQVAEEGNVKGIEETL
jgi:GPH family glycoside/pentoside/hexuronide:cation symporter